MKSFFILWAVAFLVILLCFTNSAYVWMLSMWLRTAIMAVIVALVIKGVYMGLRFVFWKEVKQ